MVGTDVSYDEYWLNNTLTGVLFDMKFINMVDIVDFWMFVLLGRGRILLDFFSKKEIESWEAICWNWNDDCVVMSVWDHEKMFGAQ